MPYKHVNGFLNKAQTMYIFPIEESPILRFFLKSTNMKYSTLSRNSHFYRDSHRADSLIKIYHLWGEYHVSKRHLEVHPQWVIGVSKTHSG